MMEKTRIILVYKGEIKNIYIIYVIEQKHTNIDTEQNY